MKKFLIFSIVLVVLSLVSCPDRLYSDREGIAYAKKAKLASTGESFDTYIDKDLSMYEITRITKSWRFDRSTSNMLEKGEFGMGWTAKCRVTIEAPKEAADQKPIVLEYGVKLFHACGKPMLLRGSFYKIGTDGKRVLIDPVSRVNSQNRSIAYENIGV